VPKNGDWLHRPKPRDAANHSTRHIGAWTVLPVLVFALLKQHADTNYGINGLHQYVYCQRRARSIFTRLEIERKHSLFTRLQFCPVQFDYQAWNIGRLKL